MPLLRIKAFRAFYGATIYPTFRNDLCLPFSTTSGDRSDEQPPQFEISAKFPDVLQQQCKNWMRAVWAEQKTRKAKQKWKNCELKCTNVTATANNTSELTMSMENLTDEAKKVFLRYITPTTPVLLRPFVKCPWQEDIVGFLSKHLFNPRGHLSASIIYVKRGFNRAQEEQIKSTVFDIKLTRDSGVYQEFTTWLKMNNEWVRMPGFNAMLYSFKCKPWPAAEKIGHDLLTDWIGKEEKNLFDHSQLTALCAVQNLNRPIVAVHGPPGTGKTMLLVRHLQQLKKQGKHVFVLSSSLPALYNLIGNYQKTTKDANFFILSKFNKQLADRVVDDPNIRQNMEKQSVLIKDMPNLMDGKVVFSTPSGAIINILARRRITFDVFIVEEANAINEFETWWMALPLAPIIRLFGNCDGLEAPISSEEAHELDFDKSLLKRLDEQFGPDVNFYLQRQYRSTAVIQEWPARAFYGQRAAQADKSVKKLQLTDFLLPDVKMITDPFILVDLNHLEGEWRKTMFEPKMGGFSYYNFGEALLLVQHLHKLFENMQQQCEPSQIAYFTQYEAQNVEIKHLFECFFPALIKDLDKVRFRQLEMDGQSCEIVLQSFVTADQARKYLCSPFHLKRLAFEMTRAKRQYMLFARSEWLEEGSDESRQLLDIFRSHGRIVGPNDLLKLKHHTQIYEMQAKILMMVRRRRFAEERRKNSTDQYK